MILLDSNVLIDSARIESVALRDWIASTMPAVSGVTYIEVSRYHKITEADRTYFAGVFANLKVLDVDRTIMDRAVALRQIRKLGLGDSIIAATALVRCAPLATRNTADFRWIEELVLIDPSMAGSKLAGEEPRRSANGRPSEPEAPPPEGGPPT